MSGKVIQMLRDSPLAAVLSEAELHLLASCGRFDTFSPGQTILESPGDERLFVLREGQVSLHLTMWSEGGTCGGDATFEVNHSGEPFGWSAWVQPDRITLSARAVGPVSLIALDLDRLPDGETFSKIRPLMLSRLYAWLQAGGICPPNLQGILKLKHLLQTV